MALVLISLGVIMQHFEFASLLSWIDIVVGALMLLFGILAASASD